MGNGKGQNIFNLIITSFVILILAIALWTTVQATRNQVNLEDVFIPEERANNNENITALFLQEVNLAFVNISSNTDVLTTTSLIIFPETHGVNLPFGGSDSRDRGFRITMKQTAILTNVTKSTGTACTNAKLYNGTLFLLQTKTFIGDLVIFDEPFQKGEDFVILCGNNFVSYIFENSLTSGTPSYPLEDSVINWTNGVVNLSIGTFIESTTPNYHPIIRLGFNISQGTILERNVDYLINNTPGQVNLQTLVFANRIINADYNHTLSVAETIQVERDNPDSIILDVILLILAIGVLAIIAIQLMQELKGVK